MAVVVVIGDPQQRSWKKSGGGGAPTPQPGAAFGPRWGAGAAEQLPKARPRDLLRGATRRGARNPEARNASGCLPGEALRPPAPLRSAAAAPGRTRRGRAGPS